MTNDINKLAVISTKDTSIDQTVRRMANESHSVDYPGLSVIVDEDNKVLGVVTDGDIRRAYAADINWLRPISEIMTENPIKINHNTAKERITFEVYRLTKSANHLSSDSVRHIIVVDDDDKLVNIYDFLELIAEQDVWRQNVSVIGLGYVGLTLAVVLANQGHMVTGVDNNSHVVNRLLDNDPHIHEPSIVEMLTSVRKRGSFEVKQELDTNHHNVYIIAVGTPVLENGEPDYSDVIAVSKYIASYLNHGDQILLRSTVPVGTTRSKIIPLLEEGSGLKAGKQFHVAFTPERTLAGNALEELHKLPQIVGGLTPQCTAKAVSFWASITPSIVRVPNLEAAEIVKLTNNTFRDLSFAFSNEIALLADDYNIDAFDLITAANQGYSRNPIPLPSPGVGGYCLTKDPYLLATSFTGDDTFPKLGLVGRETNTKATNYVIDAVVKYSKLSDKKLEKLKVLIVGLAFKGEPETNDIRGSISIDVGKKLQESDATVSSWDAIVSKQEIESAGFNSVDNLESSLADSDVILLLNNHRANSNTGFIGIEYTAKPVLIFDGWHQLDRKEIEGTSGLVYSTMGYMTPETDWI